MDIQTAALRHWPLIEVLPTVMGKNVSDHIATTFQTWVSTGREQFLPMDLGQSKGYRIALTHNKIILCLYVKLF